MWTELCTKVTHLFSNPLYFFVSCDISSDSIECFMSYLSSHEEHNFFLKNCILFISNIIIDV